MLRWISIAALVVLLVGGCSELSSVGDALRGATPREEYTASLVRAGLDETPLGRAWEQAGQAALDAAAPVTLPHAETGFFDPADPGAAAYRFSVQEGQQLRLRVAPPDSTALFVDLYEVTGDSVRSYRPIESGRDSVEIVRDADEDATYVLRLQPELLRGGRYRVTIEAGASLGFPVTGHDSGDIGSVFGASRDGGRREHHGVDIFAPRGTPVVAVREGLVTRVNETNLGGKVVWLRGGGRAYYYAHLDSQLVQVGSRVDAGDTLGLVGNTGNARTTPPHLHFGIYGGGPRDPFPFIHEPPEEPATVTTDLEGLGRRVRTASRVSVRAAPKGNAAVREELPRYSVATVVGASGDWYSIVLPDGRRGYVPSRAVTSTESALRRLSVTDGRMLHAAPHRGATPVDSLGAGVSVEVLGEWRESLLVAAPSGRTGWISSDT